jgi:F-type H+-transporting ATPase subunit gamma
MEEAERLTARLANIRSVEPILAAMRTIALGNRLLSINRALEVAQYRQELQDILALIAPLLAREAPARRTQGQTAGHLVLLVIGSERGLCGAFNDTVAAQAEAFLSQHTGAEEEVTLISLGRQTEKALRRQGRLPVWSGRLSATALPPSEIASELTTQWLDAYEIGKLNGVYVAHNVRRGMATYSSITTKLLPLGLPAAAAREVEWPPIVETEPAALRSRLARLWLSAAFYGIMLDSAAAEHSARYQLLEGAVQNAQRMIEELEMSLRVARQEAITTEVQDLASGAGLVG